MALTIMVVLMVVSVLSVAAALRVSTSLSALSSGLRWRRREAVVQPDLLTLTNEHAEDLINTRLASAAKSLQELKDVNDRFHASVLHYEDLYVIVHKRFPAGYSRVSSLTHSLALSIAERDRIYAHYDDCLRRRTLYQSQNRNDRDSEDHDNDLFLDYVFICYKQLLFMEEESVEVQRKIARLHKNYNLLLPPLLQ